MSANFYNAELTAIVDEMFRDNFTKQIERKVNEIGLPDNISKSLMKSGMIYVSDVMYELVSNTDMVCLGVTQEKAEIIVKKLNEMHLKLGISREPIYELELSKGLLQSLELKYKSIQDMLIYGFGGLVDTFSVGEAIEIAFALRKKGYLLSGFPGLEKEEFYKKTRDFLIEQPLSFIGIPKEIEEKFAYAIDEDICIDFLVDEPLENLYTYCQDIDECFRIHNILKCFGSVKEIYNIETDKNAFLKENTVRYKSIDEIQLTDRIKKRLKKAGITYVEELVSISANDLVNKKIIDDIMLSEIRRVLYKGHILLKDDYVIVCKDCNKRYVTNDLNSNKCYACLEKEKRVSRIDLIDISVDGPEYKFAWKAPMEFAVYANIKNVTNRVIKVQVSDFYLVENDKHIAPIAYEEGYEFREEMIIPRTIKAIGKKWTSKRFQSDFELAYNTYAILSLKIDDESVFRMFKFAYKNHGWILDDYFLV